MALSGLDRSQVDSVKCITLHLHSVLAGKEGAADSKQQGRINVFPGAAHHSLCRLPQSLKTDSTTTLTRAPRSKGMVLRRRQADGDRFALSDCRRRVILSPVSRPADSVSSEGEPWCVV